MFKIKSVVKIKDSLGEILTNHDILSRIKKLEK